MSQLSYEPKAQITLITPNGRRILSGELSRYLVVSAVALAADVGLLSLLSAGFGAPYLIANPIAFAMGAMIAYFGSVHLGLPEPEIVQQGRRIADFRGHWRRRPGGQRERAVAGHRGGGAKPDNGQTGRRRDLVRL